MRVEKMSAEIGNIDIRDEYTSFVWSIDFNVCRDKKVGEFICSSSFLTPHHYNGTSEWKLQLYPNGINKKSRGYLSVYIRQVEQKNSSFLQRAVYFSLLNAYDEEINKTNVDMFFSGSTWGVDRLIQKSEVAKNTNSILVNGNLLIMCCIADIKTMPKFSQSIVTAVIKPQPMPRSLSLDDLLECNSEPESDMESEVSRKSSEGSDDFESLLENGRSDVTVIANGKRFYGHKAILAARSPVFATMFEQDKIERKRSEIDMGEAISSEILKEVMRYIYIGQVTNIEDTVSQLLAPANKYRLDELKSICEDIMIKNLSIYNASEYLVLSFAHEAVKLRDLAMDFVVQNSKDIMETPGFKAMAGSHAHVIAAIFGALALKEKSEG